MRITMELEQRAIEIEQNENIIIMCNSSPMQEEKMRRVPGKSDCTSVPDRIIE